MVKIVNDPSHQFEKSRMEGYNRELIRLFKRFLDATNGQFKNEILLVINGRLF